MRSMSGRLLLSLCVLLLPSLAFAHNVTVSGTTSFSSLDGSLDDHDGLANGVFTVSDGDLIVNGTINCNDDVATNACSMAFNASGDIIVNAGGALYAENRSGGGNGGAITFTAGRDLVLNGPSVTLAGAIVSSAAITGSNGGTITASVTRNATFAAGSTIDAGSANALAGDITVTAGGALSADGNIFSGPSRTMLATRLTGVILNGGSANSVGGDITLTSTGFAEPAVVIGASASIVSQGEKNASGSVTVEGCGVEIRGLIAAMSSKNSTASVVIRSGKDVLIDGSDLGAAGSRQARLRADAAKDSAGNNRVDVFAAETITVLGPGPSSTLYVVSSSPIHNDSKNNGGTVRVISTAESVVMAGNVIDAGRSVNGNRGGSVSISATGDVDLDTAGIRALGDGTAKKDSAGGSITVRSHSGNVSWTNGFGNVRPTGSASGLPIADQGKIVITACGTVNTSGSSFPTNGAPVGPWPVTNTGVCSPANPSLPAGTPSLIVCNTPPVANDTAASTNEDNSVTVTMTGSDADGDTLTFSVVSGPSNGSVGPVTFVNATTSTVVYTPNANYFGSDSFTFQANDGNGGTDNGVATITIAPVNDPPTFQAGPTVIVLEDSGAYSAAWATSISPGPANEAGQTVTFTVTNDNNALFSVQPSVASNGTLSFTPAANAYGSATITVTATDNGGTASGGVDTSAPQSVTITVTPVNDAPSFTAGANQTASEDGGAQTVVGWATAISAGPNESGQNVTFNVTNGNNALFSVQPAIAPNGTLTYTPAANANGSATVTVTISDDGGLANGGVDTSGPQTFTITINAVNDDPSFTSGGDVTALEDSGAYSAPWATGISAGPADESGQTVSFNVSNSNNALFAVQPSIDPSGVLTFTPAANAFGSATVTVTLSDSAGGTSAPQTFTITIDPVNDAPSFVSGGDVTRNEDAGAQSIAWATSISAGPNESGQALTFNILGNTNPGLFSVQPAVSASGVLTFQSAPNAYGSATITLNLSDNGGIANGGVDTSGNVSFTITIAPVNDPPVAAPDAYDTIGNTRLQVSSSQTVMNPSVFVNGTVLGNDSDVDSPSLTATLIGGSVTAGATVMMNADGTFIYVPPAGHAGATDSFSYTLSDGAATTTGTVTITLKGRVWYVRNNGPAGTGRSIDSFAVLANAQAASVAGDTIYVYAGDGTTTGQTSGFQLKNGQRLIGEGVALTVPVSVNGGPNPTVLLPAGATPKITDGGNIIRATNVSNIEVAGLQLSGSSLDGIRLTNVVNATISTVTVANNLGNGIYGLGVNGFTLANSTITNNADDALTDEAGIRFEELTGSASISNTTIQGSIEDNVRVVNTTGVLDRLTLTNVTIGANSLALGNDGLFLQAQNTATMKVTVQNSFLTSSRGDLFQFSVQGNAVADLVFTGNALSNNHASIVPGGGGFTISGSGANPTLTYSITNNTFRDAVGTAVAIGKGAGAGGNFTGTISGNTIGVVGVVNSGSAQGSGLVVDIVGGGMHTATITNNNIFRYTNFGILLSAGATISGGGQGILKTVVQGNTVSTPSANAVATLFPTSGIRLNSGTNTGDNAKVCLTLGGAGALANSVTGTGINGGADIRLFERFLTTVGLPGYAGANNDNAAVTAFVQSNNGGTPSVLVSNNVAAGGAGYIGSCPF